MPPSTQSDSSAPTRVETQLVYAHGLAAVIMLFVSICFGILASIELWLPDLSGGVTWLSWGRLRYDHTQGILFGWLGNAFLAFLYHAVPVLTGRPVLSARLGQWLFGLWNFCIVIPGWVLVLAGFSQPLEWAEFPLVVDAFVVLALLLAAIQFLPPFFARGLEDLYVSSWYIIGSLIFTLLAYPMGNFVPEVVPGARGAAFSGLWIHDAVGLFVTPLALAIIYYVIPAASGRPIYSHFLSMLGFWLLFFLYPLNGTHHYVFSVIPMDAQIGAITASALLGFDVILVVANLLLSLRGSGWFPRDVALRFVSMGTVYYLIVSIQGSIQAQMAVNQAVHFSDWVIGHSHLAMLGFATFAAAGGIAYAWQRIPGARYNGLAMSVSYWLLFAGVAIMVLDLTTAGLVEARLWQSAAPWLDSVRAAKPYWQLRTLSAIPLGAGFIAFLLGLTTGRRNESAAGTEPAPHLSYATPSYATTLETPPAPAFVRMSYVVASVCGVAFFIMSVALLGIWPGRVLADQTRRMSPEHPLGLTASELRGRAIYSREGCAYCHTQQIRYLHTDMARFGAPTLAWETRADYPHLWGTRRIGPDLARESATRTADWHFAHLFEPRAVVPDSVMPAYTALFDGSPDRPRQAARDLLAYLESLGRAREVAGPEGEAHALAACNCKDDEMAQMAFHAAALNANPEKPRRQGDFPNLAADGDLQRGQEIYLHNCVSCHGPRGDGNGPGTAGLHPAPANLAEHEYTLDRLSFVFRNGAAGSSMPAWRDFSTTDLSALARVVRGFHVAQPEPSLPANILELGAKVYTANCAQCHGENGAGDGFAASQFPLIPANLRGERPSIAQALRALRNGVEGTEMAPWTGRLSEDELSAVAYYVRTFYEGGGQR